MSISKQLQRTLAFAIAFSSTAAAAQPLCLDSRYIHDSRAVNTHTILFQMTDGSRYRGTLAVDCPGLRFNGFVIFPANSDRVCEGIQTIRILQDHQVCRIASITPIGATTKPY